MLLKRQIPAAATGPVARIIEAAGQIILGKEAQIRMALACLLARGLSPIRDAASGYFLIRRDIARRVTIKAGGFKICLELIVRAWPTTLVELPYQFDDREQGESKMNKREAAGYLFQLKDLYLLRWSQRNRPARTYKCLSVAEVKRLEVRGDRSEFR